MINPDHPLSVVRNASCCSGPIDGVLAPLPTPETDLTLMRRLDELHLKWPFLGARKCAIC